MSYNMLIIGNGFDIAHNLPTKYSDFLKFVIYIREKLFSECHPNFNYEKWEIDSRIKDLVDMEMVNVKDNLYSIRDILYNKMDSNIWINYFVSISDSLSDKWVDFEEEMGRVVCALGELYYKKIILKYDQPVENFIDLIIQQIAKRTEYEPTDGLCVFKEKQQFESYFKELERSLNDLELCLEYYLGHFVNKLNIENVSSDIENILNENINVEVINFNYTEIINRTYNRKISECFIHGNLNVDRNINDDCCEIVLGIDEFTFEDNYVRKLCIPFEKAYRKEIKRISHNAIKQIYRLKKISNKKKKDRQILNNEILKLGKELSDKDVKGNALSNSRYRKTTNLNNQMLALNKNHVFIFGHSLAFSDREYLKILFGLPETIIEIYYHNDGSLGEMLKNLILLVGSKKCRKKLNNEEIVFKKQQN